MAAAPVRFKDSFFGIVLAPLVYKIIPMTRDHADASKDVNKEQHNTGIPNKLHPEDSARNEEMTEKYTDDDHNVADSVRINNPNRNVDKEDVTNAGGYRN